MTNKPLLSIRYAATLAVHAGLGEESDHIVRKAGLLHDIGKS